MRDLLDAPESEWSIERSKVEVEGWGAELLSHQDEDGQWAGGAFLPRNFQASEWEEIAPRVGPWPLFGGDQTNCSAGWREFSLG
jgi:hypothetical protein